MCAARSDTVACVFDCFCMCARVCFCLCVCECFTLFFSPGMIADPIQSLSLVQMKSSLQSHVTITLVCRLDKKFKGKEQKEKSSKFVAPAHFHRKLKFTANN